MPPSSVLLVATEWTPSKGGVSSFNQELAAALARVGHHVECVVDEATPEDVASAAALQVVLHSSLDHGVRPGASFALARAPEIVIGHGRWSGVAAERWRERYPQARLVHLAHVHPAQIDGLKTRGAIEQREARIRATADFARGAEVFAAVGPLLADWWMSSLPDVSVFTFTPGLPHLLPARQRTTPVHPRVLFVGRAEDAELKGLEVAATAMSRVARTRHDLEWVVRGVDRDAVAPFERELRGSYPKPALLSTRPFSASREDIADDLASAWLVIQPSLQEGFGLVTLEALRAGVPVLVGGNSGVARVLASVAPALASAFIVDGNATDAWADAIEGVLANISEARDRTRDLAAALDRVHTWGDAATALVERARNAALRDAAKRSRSIAEQLRDASRPLQRVIRTLPDGNWIPRTQETAIQQWIDSDDPDAEPLLVLLGAPGTGKSALLSRLVEQATKALVPVLGIKADFLPATVETAPALAIHLGFDRPVIDILRDAVAENGRALLVIDQLDALCAIVDASTLRLNVLIQLIRTAADIEGVRVVASVRPFELRHEARLRTLQQSAHMVDLPGLTRSDLVAALPNVEVPDPVPSDLATPHALDLMQCVRQARGHAFAFPSAIGELRELFWAIAMDGQPARETAARQLAADLGATGALWIGKPADAIYDGLVRSGLLHRIDDQRIGFRHQTLFDLAHARDLLENGTLAAFAAAHQEQLDVRPLLRSALAHLRARDRRRFSEAVDELWNRPDLALHLRLLLLDCLTDVDSPSASDRPAFQQGVARADTRRRALNLIAFKPNWIAALEDSIDRWLRDYPAESVLLACGYVRSAPERGLEVVERCWLRAPGGAARCVDVLTAQEELGPEADRLLDALVVEIVAHHPHASFRLAPAIARRSDERAARFLLACLDEATRRVSVGGTLSRDLHLTEDLLKLDAALGLVLDHIEAAFVRFVSEHPKEWNSDRHTHEETLVELLEKLLEKQARQAPADLLIRAARVPAASSLERIYLRVLSGMDAYMDERAGWLASEPSRLRRDHLTANLLRTLAAKLSAAQVTALDTAIDRVLLYRVDASDDPKWRAHADKYNRSYRVFLRELLPSTLREPRRIAFDVGERHQLPRHAERREARMSYVRSPMTKGQLLRAKPEHVLRALDRKEEFSRWHDDDGPVGDGRQVLGELAKAGEDEPEKVAVIVRELLARDRKDEARQVLHGLAKSWNDAPSIEAFIAAAMATDGASLDEDTECAWALGYLADRGRLSDRGVALILHRLANAGVMAEPEREPQEERHRLAIFHRTGFGGHTVPWGAYPWLVALMDHYGRRGAVDHATWADAVRNALRADHTIATWSVLLDRLYAWGWLAGEHSLALLEEIERAIPNARMTHPLARAYAHSRDRVTDDSMRAFVDRLVEQSADIPAAELTAVAATDKPCEWATDHLADWARGSRAAQFGAGVAACIGDLLGEMDRRRTLADLAVTWVPLLDAGDLELVLRRNHDDEAWVADEDGRRVIGSLARRIGEMTRDALSAFVAVLERFIEADALAVLSAVESALSRALSLDDQGVQPIVSECLALTFSLRIALPKERARVLAVFERALAADSLAAIDALGVADGRASPITQYLTMPLRSRRRTTRRKKRR